MSFTVAVTGPTGDVGRAFPPALESADRVDRVLGLARDTQRATVEAARARGLV